MEKGNEYAFAMLDNNGAFTQYGLTKREYFAAMAMQGFCANIGTGIVNHGNNHYAADCATMVADALINALNKNTHPDGPK